LEDPGDLAIARAEPAAATAVSKHHDPGRVRRHREIPIQVTIFQRNPDRYLLGFGAHGPPPFPVDVAAADARASRRLTAPAASVPADQGRPRRRTGTRASADRDRRYSVLRSSVAAANGRTATRRGDAAVPRLCRESSRGGRLGDR